MRILILPIALGLGLALVGCEETGAPDRTETTAGAPTTGAPTTTAEPARDVPEKSRKAIEIARQVKQDPQQLDAALKQAGMTQDEFDELMYDVAADPKLTDPYLAQREGAADTRRQ